MSSRSRATRLEVDVGDVVALGQGAAISRSSAGRLSWPGRVGSCQRATRMMLKIGQVDGQQHRRPPGGP